MVINDPTRIRYAGAITLAALKQKLGENVVPARLGHLNPETKYILDKVGVPAPIRLSTAKNSLEEIEIDQATLINQNDTLRLRLGSDAGK